jgi:hypothetical protein
MIGVEQGDLDFISRFQFNTSWGLEGYSFLQVESASAENIGHKFSYESVLQVLIRCFMRL